MLANATEIVQIVREVTAVMGPKLERYLAATYGPTWLEIVNGHLAQQGLSPGAALVERFCLAVCAYDPATFGWAGADRRQLAEDLFALAGPAYDDQPIPTADVVRAREIASAIHGGSGSDHQDLPATPKQFAALIAEATFRKPPLGKRGYAEDEVDGFLDWVSERCVSGASVSPADIQRAAFQKPPRGRRGYDEQDVDEFLEWMKATLTAFES
ncbi:hypothetical protein GCM10009765_68650 [Fodinicola feengrottensis]|uniref:Cell wall synthesis protein Wag31 n=1 Tax=Fodinicola feengrottensis TaxID=435914 RepID=A0ABP4UPU1_9ACTN